MGFGESAAALRAKAELAKRHAAELSRDTREQRARTLAQREVEEAAAAAAKAAAQLQGDELRCDRCGAVWRREAVLEATRRRPGCLLCGGSLTPLP